MHILQRYILLLSFALPFRMGAQPIFTNLLQPHVTDSLLSLVSGFVETPDHYIFSVNYTNSQNEIIKYPYRSCGFILVSKQNLQSQQLFFPMNQDTAYAIQYMKKMGDTIHTIEMKFVREAANPNVRHLWMHRNRYTLNLDLLHSVEVEYQTETLTNNFGIYPVVYFNRDVYVLVHTDYGDIKQQYYSVYDFHTDTLIQYMQPLNPIRPMATEWWEEARYISEDYNGNLLVSCFFTGSDDGGLQAYELSHRLVITRLNKQNQYAPERLKYFSGIKDTLDSNPDVTYISVIAGNYLPYIKQHYNSYYMLQSSSIAFFNINTPVDGSADSSSERMVIYKARDEDSALRAYKGFIAPSAPNYGSQMQPHDWRHTLSAADEALLFIDDTIIVDVHLSRVSSQASFEVLCYKPYTSPGLPPPAYYAADIQINILDTALRHIATHYIFDTLRNAWVSGFKLTEDKQLMIYGSYCPHNSHYDSTKMFAFLVDYQSGNPVSIFNAENFINPNTWEIFPNPSHGRFTVKGYQWQDCEVLLTDLTGRIIHQQPLTGLNTVIHTENLPPGIYICTLLNTKSKQQQYNAKIAIH
jgi:hypothetical protein